MTCVAGAPGMGGPPQPPPPPKEFPGGAKKARTMLKELKAAFKTKTATEAFAAASDDPQERMQTLGPQLEGLTASVVKKYGFDGGFNEAMQSIAAVGGKEQDEKIRALMVSPPCFWLSQRTIIQWLKRCVTAGGLGRDHHWREKPAQAQGGE